MSFTLTFVFVAISSILCITNSYTVTSDDEFLAREMAPPNPCPDSNCTRVRNPVCSSIEDELLTDINRCHYNHRVKCIKEYFPDDPVPTFLHEGECRGTECVAYPNLTNIRILYKPVCSSVDGVPETDVNNYVFQFKRRCANNFRKKEGKKKPVVRFLHNGECYGNEGKCWRQCPNVRRPVCGTINKRFTTETNRCILNNKIRCNNMLRNQGKQAQNIKFRYAGKCRQNQNRQNNNRG